MNRCLSQRLLILTCAIVSLAMSSATPAAGSAQPIRAGALEIFYGVIPTEILLGHPGSHEERQMHGGTPRGRGQHHLIVSVFDGKSRERVGNAAVTARVGEIGLSVQEKRMEPMQFGGTARSTSGMPKIRRDSFRSSGRSAGPMQVPE